MTNPNTDTITGYVSGRGDEYADDLRAIHDLADQMIDENERGFCSCHQDAGRCGWHLLPHGSGYDARHSAFEAAAGVVGIDETEDGIHVLAEQYGLDRAGR